MVGESTAVEKDWLKRDKAATAALTGSLLCARSPPQTRAPIMPAARAARRERLHPGHTERRAPCFAGARLVRSWGKAGTREPRAGLLATVPLAIGACPRPSLVAS